MKTTTFLIIREHFAKAHGLPLRIPRSKLIGNGKLSILVDIPGQREYVQIPKDDILIFEQRPLEE